MEGCATDGSPPTGEDEEKFEHVKEADSATNFQRFVYDLFEKNGILTDLRAYLRGHIVNVLKSAQTGEPPTCQKHFTQRLELPCQALNMLIAEYLLRLEFSYSLSVFVSEIPLANMVFDFAKNLMISNQGDFENLKFKDSDVWSILNYLGVKCDSEHASRILELYNGKDNLPLLFCIMKCMPMYNKEPFCENQAISSSESVSSSAKSQDFDEEKHRSASRVCSHDRCRHYVFCKTCHAKMTRLREKYRTKKKHLIKMFQQLKNVYEAEMEMMKQEEEKKIKRSLASHALQLQRRQDEMEESFKARETELERSVQEKKKFLWGLARALRDQHATMARAMHAVRHETDRLTAKEDSLKSQLVEAEQVLRKRGEDMREQISSELIILEGHLESMKKERETINRERAELQTLKTACDLRGDDSGCVIKANDLNNDELRSHYDLLKNELSILKKYLETTKLQPKCVIERSTLTELSDVSSKIQIVLNNDQDVQRIPVKSESDERRTPNKVVNDLKKPKNVNFCTSNVEEVYHESGISRSRSRSSCSDAGDLLHHLRDENERLKTFARQQREHIDELTSHQARLQAELAAVCHRPEPRPRTAPAHIPREPILRLNTSASVSSVGWRKGAGEELSVFSNAQPRILLPGDTLPFIGVLRDRHSDNRKHLINQWRALRRRMSPVGGVSKRPLAPARDRSRERPGTAIPTVSVFPSSRNDEDAEDTPNPRLNETFTFTAVARERPKTAVTQRKLAETHQCREKSPKTMLREAKENLRNKTDVKDHPPSKAREKSPNAVLREAKLRLRKLEIEAEAVERSYLDFRRRHADKRPDTVNAQQAKELIASIDLHKTSPYKLQENFRIDQTPHTASNHDRNIMKQDFHKYLCEYETKFDATASHLKGTGNASKPIPTVYSKIGDFEGQRKDNYLETPLEEFRKLYTQTPTTPKEPANIHRTDSPNMRNTPETPLEEFRKLYSQKPTVPSVPVNFPQIEKESPRNTSEPPTAPEDRESTDSRKTRDVNKQDELEILKDNISKMYNLHKQDEKPTGGERSESPELKESIVIEVEHVSEANSLRVTGSEVGDLVLVVESSPDARAPGTEQISPHMTILVSPKAETPGDHDPSPDQASIFHASRKRRPSEADPAESFSNLDAIPDDYPDDFSADVDNYNSRSDYNDADHSPISLPKNSEDDNFWDS